MTEINNQTQEYNKEVIDWSNETRRLIHGKIPKARKHSLKQTTQEIPLSRSFRLNTSKTFGEIDRIGYIFSLHGVFIQRGVGRGYISKNGIVSRGIKIRNKQKTNAKRTDFRSISGAIVRRPVDWFNGPLQTRFEKLADIVAEHKAGQVMVNFQRMKI